ncbi:amidohydrolase family protein [Pseudonocardia sp. HH130629-09]|uniref:amidohydrolase family protein n=1 Tax=Pseudonocardia sp. HH130629-09 TaxID=1641402 RepID=UPI0006CB0009|nr:amidohydrolase family protein [Pseudonocardia sp. HH130629-09]ALE83965.1 hydrolase [Pseudonocardia sp. HH130629-09]
MFNVDTHTHIISSDTATYPAAPLGGHRSTWSQERPADIDGLLREADAAGVEHLVLVQASTVYGFDNSYVADQLDVRSDRLSGVCSVDFLSPNAADDLHHWISERGFSGVRIRAADGTTTVPTPGRGLDDERMTPVWEYVSTHRVPVCIQMHAQHAPTLADLLERYPGLTVLLDHGGRPQLEATTPYPVPLGATGRVHAKITPPAVLRAQREVGSAAPLVTALVAEFGASNVLWGSNFPASVGSLAELYDLITAQLPTLDDGDLAAVLGGNAARIYGLAAEAAATG